MTNLDELQTAHDAGRAEGAAAERARIVAWLRSITNGSAERRLAWAMIARLIENGDHGQAS